MSLGQIPERTFGRVAPTFVGGGIRRGRPPGVLGHEERIEPAHGRYHRCFALRGDPGSLWLQHVDAEVRFVAAGEVLVTYRSCYGEYFRLDGQGGHPDRHDFDVRRDGWTRNAVERLLRRHAAEGVRDMGAGPFEVVVRKTFTLGAGRVEETSARPDGAGGFGLLVHGPLGPAHAELTLARTGGGEPYRVPSVNRFPKRQQGEGHGWFTTSHGWSMVEMFRHEPIARCGSFDDGGGYRVVNLDEPSLGFACSRAEQGPE